MKRIFFVITKDDVGGAQKYVRELAGQLDTEKFKVKILTGGKGGLRFLSNSLRPHFLFLNDLLALAELVVIFHRGKPDIVHLNSSKAGVIGAFAAKLAGVPKVIFTAHGWVFNPDNNLSWLRRRFYIALHRLAGRFQDAIISVSKYDHQLAIQNRIADPKKLSMVYNGIERIDFLDKKTARKALSVLLRPKLHTLNPSEIWVGSLGRLVMEKDYGTFIEAAKLVPAASFFIIGSGYELTKLQAKIKKLGLESRFFIVEMAPGAPYLKAFDVFTLTSIKEGLPYTMLEAMAAEVPMVVTRVGGMPEIVNGRGLVMPPREPAEIARAIQYYLDNPQAAKKSAESARRFLEENLQLSRLVSETEQIYTGLFLTG